MARWHGVPATRRQPLGPRPPVMRMRPPGERPRAHSQPLRQRRAGSHDRGTRHPVRRAALGPAPPLSSAQRPVIPADPQGTVQSSGLLPSTVGARPTRPARMSAVRAVLEPAPHSTHLSRSGRNHGRASPRDRQPRKAARRVACRAVLGSAPFSYAVHQPATAADAHLGARSPRVCSHSHPFAQRSSLAAVRALAVAATPGGPTRGMTCSPQVCPPFSITRRV